MSPIDRSRLILSSSLVIICSVTVLATLRVLLTGIENFPSGAALVVAGCLANILFLKKTDSTDVAAKIFVGLLLAGLAFGGINNYGFGGPILLLAPLIAVFAVLLLEPKAALVSIGLVLALLLAVYYLELSGYVAGNPNSDSQVLLGRLLTLLTLCLVISWIVWRFARYSQTLLRQIEKQSTTDYLTGILNRRGIELVLSREVARARRSDTWLSLIVIDVDYFKVFNDNNGHLAGDRCLVQIAQTLRSCVTRCTDLLGRFGGEEFLLILPDTPPEGARTVAETIGRRMREQEIAYGSGTPDLVTLTLGVVSGRGRNVQSSEDLFHHADNALYDGKKAGRNCVVCRVIDSRSECGPVDPAETIFDLSERSDP